MDKSRLAINLFDRLAKLYEEKYMDVSQYHASLDLFCTRIAKQHAHVLEVACGPGNNTHYILQQRPDLKILATDMAPNMLERALANNPGIECRLMDGRSIATLHMQFDAIICGFLLPYLSADEVAQFIRDAAAALVPGGVLYLSTMEGDYAESGWKASSTGDELYIYYHPADELVRCLEENGFQEIGLQRTDVDVMIIARH